MLVCGPVTITLTPLGSLEGRHLNADELRRLRQELDLVQSHIEDVGYRGRADLEAQELGLLRVLRRHGLWRKDQDVEDVAL